MGGFEQIHDSLKRYQKSCAIYEEVGGSPTLKVIVL